jgi:16S rRNA (cytosine967-C5)-methyltransferase
VSRYHSYLNSAVSILKTYRGDEPFASFLKKYFAANKKFGSKDRKQVSNLCYCFFRLGKAVMNVSLEEKILTALFLCSDQSNEILEALKPEWNKKINLTNQKKLLIINPPAGRAGYSLLITDVFPWKEELSAEIDYEEFSKSFFIQPDLFLRLRPGKENAVKLKLLDAGIQFRSLSSTCLSLSNASKIDSILEPDKEAVIQDYSSQQTGGFIKSAIVNPKLKINLWDCCAGSGGKSLMAYDSNTKIDLTVSDVRESILANLKKRFETAGIKKYEAFVADLTGNRQPVTGSYDLIIADVPCTGSGTWSRTPEQLYFFDEKKIREYSVLQRKIVSNVIPHLKPGGCFIYLTCSVFRRENEEMVEFIRQNFQLALKQTEILKGYDKKADSMFVAVFSS